MQVYAVVGTGDLESVSIEWAVKVFWDPIAAQRFARGVRKHPEVDLERPEGLIGKARYFPVAVPYGYEEWEGKEEEGIYLVWCRERGPNDGRYDCTVCWYGREVQARMHCIWAKAWLADHLLDSWTKNPYDPGWVGPAIGVPEYWFEKVEMGRE